jgi:hypothetical protein
MENKSFDDAERERERESHHNLQKKVDGSTPGLCRLRNLKVNRRSLESYPGRN